MDVEEIQTQPRKFSNVIGRNVAQPNKLVHSGDVATAAAEQQCRDEGDKIRKGGIVVPGSDETVARLCGWHHSSRIYRVSRASGGKDRHSKVLTSKGLRDRRVRLSVSTAIAFYDLQDRLGYDQPSKAVEWLIKAADEAIAELPSLNCAFPDTPPKLLTDGMRAEHSVEMELADAYLNYQHRQQQQQLSLSKSASSSNSETSKGSGLSLSRPDIRVSRVKARERASERAVKEREINQYNGENPITLNSSFTELLTTGISGISNNNTSTGSGSAQHCPGEEGRQWPPSAPVDYFTSGLFESGRTHHSNLGFFNQIQSGNYYLPQSMIIPTFSHHSSEQQHFSFMPDHLQSKRGGVENYNLNFTMPTSSGLAGSNRGTLQSNSLFVPSLFPHLQRFSPQDGSSNIPFFIGAAVALSAAAPLENNHYHQFASGFGAT